MEMEQKGRLTEKIKQEVKMNSFDYYEKFDNLEKIWKKIKNLNEDIQINYLKKMHLATSDVGFLIYKYKCFESNTIIEYYKSLKPSAADVSFLLRNSYYACNTRTMDYFMQLKPTAEDFILVLFNCSYLGGKYSGAKMLDYYKKLNPPIRDIKWILLNCGWARRLSMLKYYKKLMPTDSYFDELIQQKSRKLQRK